MNLEDVFLFLCIGAAVGWLARGEFEDWSERRFSRGLFRRDK